jgi:hypothetical protein
MKQDILNFGLERFPNATPSSQSAKVREEVEEMYREVPYTTKWWYERADVYIASVHGEERFHLPMCRFIVESLENGDDFDELKYYIKSKMVTNKKRKWKGNKHVTEKNIIKRINYKTGEIIEEKINVKNI